MESTWYWMRYSACMTQRHAIDRRKFAAAGKEYATSLRRIRDSEDSTLWYQNRADQRLSAQSPIANRGLPERQRSQMLGLLCFSQAVWTTVPRECFSRKRNEGNLTGCWRCKTYRIHCQAFYICLYITSYRVTFLLEHLTFERFALPSEWLG